MEIARWKYLLEQLYLQQISPAEKAELEQALREDPPAEPVESYLEELMAAHIPQEVLPAQDADVLFDRITMQLPKPAVVRRLNFRRWRLTAAVLLLLAGSGLVWKLTTKQPARSIPVAVILPGSDKAVLTLADGTQVTLDSSGRQTLQQEGASINQDNGLLSYHQTGNTGGQASYNVLTTPKGGQFKLVLPDKSTVWLNAASSIRYPVAFNGKDRVVTITGEAYFEVAPVADQPFKVNIPGGSTVEVLGTVFNVHAYTGEQHYLTTLLDGKVQVRNTGTPAVLQPGQQVDTRNGELSVATLPAFRLAQAVAWKNGIFDFEQMDLAAVMQEVARWYDVEVIYDGQPPHRKFGGQLSRNLSLQDLVEALKSMKVNIKILEGRKIKVSAS